MKNVQSKKRTSSVDLPDSKEDQRKMKREETTMDLPEVKDIPGQEHIHVPPLGELADTTISSSDEEGAGILDDEESVGINEDSNVSAEERMALRDAAERIPTQDDTRLQQATLDNQDEDGEALNEEVDLSGKDLDVPGSENDDANEEIGEEDEENNSYSLGSEDEDNSNTKQ